MSFNEYNPSHQNPQAWGFGGGSGWGQGQGQGYGHGAGLGQNFGQNVGLGQAAFGQQGFGGVGGWQGYGQQGWGSPWQQRSFSQQDVGEIVRHLVPLLPLIVNQAQQPHAAFGYGQGGGFGGGFGQGWNNQNQGWGQGPRYLSQQDVHEVVRQILPALPQIVNALQGQHQGQYGSAAYGGQFGGQGPFGGQGLQGLQALFGGGLGQAAYGSNTGGGAWGYGGQRQLGQGDVGEIVRHLTAILPQVIGNLQAFNQQQQRGA